MGKVLLKLHPSEKNAAASPNSKTRLDTPVKGASIKSRVAVPTVETVRYIASLTNFPIKSSLVMPISTGSRVK